MNPTGGNISVEGRLAARRSAAVNQQRQYVIDFPRVFSLKVYL